MQELAQGSAQDLDSSVQKQQAEDLQRRIEILESLDDTELGEFTRIDWALCIVGAVIIPTLVLIWVGR